MGRKGRYDEKPKRGKGRASKKQKDPDFGHVLATDDRKTDAKSLLKKRWALITVWHKVYNYFNYCRKKTVKSGPKDNNVTKKKVKFNDTVEYSNISENDLVKNSTAEESDDEQIDSDDSVDNSDLDSDEQPMIDEYNEVLEELPIPC